MIRIRNHWDGLGINPAVRDVETASLLTADEVQRIVDHAEQHPRPTSPARIFRLLLHELEDHIELFPVNQLVHSLQTATRAVRDNAPDELVFAALMHDVGKVFSGRHHAEIGAALVRAYVSGPTYEMLRHHPLFRAGLKPGARTQMVDALGPLEKESWYAMACRFEVEWDRPAFDPGYDTLSLEAFLPLLESVCGDSRLPRP
jgi:predicted HD phosphohydrolase